MVMIGIWARDGSLSDALEAALGPHARQYGWVRGSHPAELTQCQLDLLVIAPSVTGWAGATAVSSRMALIPGQAGALARSVRTGCAVSYGAGARDTLTLSSLKEGHIAIALQRELVSVSGRVIQRQELVLPFPEGEDPDRFLAVIGSLLLLDEK